jgi:hypothetical protein
MKWEKIRWEKNKEWEKERMKRRKKNEPGGEVSPFLFFNLIDFHR